MGIRFLDSILVLTAAAAGVFTAYLIGHGLSSHAGWPWPAAGASFAFAFLLGLVAARRVRSYARDRGEDLNL